ncbi:MAG TPA: hypothetical protein VFB84_19700 [Micromonosporaceae bacterium]|nr:hypothetical protein [Micromonosporaceae bacterium]
MSSPPQPGTPAGGAGTAVPTGAAAWPAPPLACRTVAGASGGRLLGRVGDPRAHGE